MNKIISFGAIFTLLISISCGSNYKLELVSPKTIQVNEKLQLSVAEKNGKQIDSVTYFLNGKNVLDYKAVDISDYKLGKQAVSATIFYQGKQKVLNNTIYFLAEYPPIVYSYSIINEYPHDKTAFTQGFEYYDGYFYESTGNYGKSSLRKVEVETGKVVQKIDLDKKYFAEGMTILNGKIYQLTWQENTGFVYDLASFKLEKTFEYGESKQGWGLTHNSEKLVKTDGTERMWFIDTQSFKEESYIETYTNKRKAEKLNELEYVNGKIYANIWQQNSLLIVNSVTGAIEGIVNLNGLQEKANQTGDDNVLNGIAYDSENDRLFVTGKKWSKVFEIKLVKK